MSDGVKAKESADIREKLKHSNMKLLNKLVNLTEEQQKDIADMWFNMKNQEKPLNMDYKDWEKAKITEGKVFGRIKQFHYRNTHPFQKKIALVHKNGGFIVVGYDPFTFRIAKDINEGMGELTDSRTLKAPELLSEVKKNIYDGLDDRVGEYEVVIPNFNELVKRKQRIWDTVRGDPDDAVKAKNALLVDALDLGKFTFGIDPASGVDFSYHREELINTVHKPYKFLNWAPGVGKTIYAFNWLKIK